MANCPIALILSMLDYHPNCIRDDPFSNYLKCNISNTIFTIAPKMCAVSIYEYLYRLNMVHMANSGQLNANMTK